MSESFRFRKIDEWRWEIPPTGGMRVPGLLYTSEKLMKGMGADEGPRQVANVAHLPGIVKGSLAMPDMHWGYGFPIGGVAAFDLTRGSSPRRRRLRHQLRLPSHDHAPSPPGRPGAHSGARHGALSERSLRRRFPGAAETLAEGGETGPDRRRGLGCPPRLGH